MNERDIFIEALQRPEQTARQGYLDEACGADTCLRRGVEALLRKHAHAGAFLEAPHALPNLAIDEPAVLECPGSIIGPYKVLEKIGEGGFGLVYLAEQQEPIRRKVALKVLKPGMDSRQILARFEAERQALALMDHPNIAKILDAGQTGSGRPYFVMDLIRGLPLTEYCDQHHLSVRDRLELFMDVCQAVQHAHQKGIIHRDLKPSNILVTLHDGASLVKVIDFGVAKALGQDLTDKTVLTTVAQLVGTPLYMSPEQASFGSVDVDTRSDIYSLGVLLYELLTGTTPFEEARLRQAPSEQVWRIIREEEPPTPSLRVQSLGQAATPIAVQRRTEPGRLRTLCRGDLDWIVMKCLEKERNCRYETASAVAADVQRYLKCEPIKARPVGKTERLWRWSRRNPMVASLSASLVIVLIAGLIGMTLLWLQADERRVQAELAGIAEGEATKLARENLARARWSLYVSRIQVARQELQEGHVTRARQLLDGLRPAGDEADLRGFEWHYLSGLCRLTLPVLQMQYRDRVDAIAYSPDGRLLAAVQVNAHAISVWDAVTGERRWQVVDPSIMPWSVSFSRDGRRVACGGYTMKVHFWDVQTSQPILPDWELTEQAKAIAFSPTEDQVATGERGGVTLRDAATGRVVARMPMANDRVNQVMYSRDGRRLAGLQVGKVIVWDVPTRKVLRTLPPTDSMGGLALSPDGRYLAQCRPNSQITVHDLQANQSFVLAGQGTNIMAWSPDGARLAAAPNGDRIIRVWDVASRKEDLRVTVHDDPVRDMAFSPDGLRLATASWDSTVRFYRVSGGGMSSPPRIDSPDGRRYYTWAGGTVKAWDAASNQELLTLEPLGGGLIGLLCSPDGAVLAGVQSLRQPPRQMVLWDTASGRRLWSLPLSEYQVGKMVFSPDGRCLAMPEYHETTEAPSERVGKLTVSRRPVVTSFKATIRILETATGRKLRSWDCLHGQVGQLEFTPNGQHLLTSVVLRTKSMDSSVVLWEASTGRPVWRLQVTSLPYNVAPPPLALSRDGRRTAVSTGEPGVLVLDTDTGEEQARLPTRGLPIPAFNEDGSRVITQEGEIRIWDAVTGEELLMMGTSGPEFQLPRRGRDGHLGFWRRPGDYVHWDVASQATEVWRNCDAALLVRLAFARSPWRDDALDELRRVPILDEAVRREALTQAQRRAMDPNALNDAARRIAGKPKTAAADLRRAAAMAEEAGRQQPKNGLFLNTQGVLAYREGHHEQALEMLLRSEQLNLSQLKSAHPADLAFLAMAAQKLDRTNEARQYLERLRTTMKLPTWAKNEESIQFLREAEDVLKPRK
jgi:eukaryotic-like serine/threonine-protein kinase